MKIIHLILLLMVIMSSCNSIRHNEYQVTGTKSQFAKHLGQGVWLTTPPGFKKATSYDGYQAPNGHSSISLKIGNESFEELLENFSERNLDLKKLRLIEKSKVIYADTIPGYYIVVKDLRKRTTKHLLAIRKNNATYTIKAFYFTQLKNQYEKLIKLSLLTSYIGNLEKKKERFQMASLDQSGNIIYTQDGLFPTKTEDELILKIEKVENFDGIIKEEFIRKRMKQLIGVTSSYHNIYPIRGGTVITTKGSKQDQKCFILLAHHKNQSDASLYTAVGNSKLDLESIENYLINQIMDIKL